MLQIEDLKIGDVIVSDHELIRIISNPKLYDDKPGYAKGFIGVEVELVRDTSKKSIYGGVGPYRPSFFTLEEYLDYPQEYRERRIKRLGLYHG
jgi:hypothetical protein